MNGSLLSIIVPVYNAQPYFTQCVESLLAQTYQNLEIILIDDGSTDGSSGLCDEFAARDSRIHVIHQKNQGVSIARNAGLSIAKGDYIGFVDSDDWIEPDMYQDMIAMMERDGTDAAFCGYWEDFQLETGYRPPVEHAPEKTGVVDYNEAVYQCLIGTNQGYYIIGCNKCFRRKLIWVNDKPIPFPEKIPLSEDELWFSYVIQNLKSASLTSKMYYHWRIHIKQSSNPLRSDASQRKILAVHQESAAQFAKCKQCASLAMGRVYDIMFRCVWISYYTGDKESERYFRKELKPYKKVFWKCRDFSLKRKVKLLVVDWMCLLHCPPDWVSRVEQASSGK